MYEELFPHFLASVTSELQNGENVFISAKNKTQRDAYDAIQSNHPEVNIRFTFFFKQYNIYKFK